MFQEHQAIYCCMDSHLKSNENLLHMCPNENQSIGIFQLMPLGLCLWVGMVKSVGANQSSPKIERLQWKLLIGWEWLSMHIDKSTNCLVDNSNEYFWHARLHKIQRFTLWMNRLQASTLQLSVRLYKCSQTCDLREKLLSLYIMICKQFRNILTMSSCSICE